MTKIGLVLEGGAMRGLYTAGVLDVFLDNNINIDGIIGVSAGALFGANYYSKQRGRALRYNKKYCKDKRYISIHSLITTGNIVNKDFAFYKVTNELDPFDDEEFIKTNKDFYVVITNVETGSAEYINIKNSTVKNLEVLRATSAMPLVSKMVEINNHKYLDGALVDSIPVTKAIDMGYDKIIVILTRPLEYRKKPFSKLESLFIKLKYRKYPKLVKAILNRYSNYNECLEKIIDLESKKEIFVIRPSRDLNISRLEKDECKLQEVYDLGINDAKKQMKKLIEFLK
ncbi:MAG: patatin family protein [Bacilli bacterium]|nr:patatin family protein [Bacilli bacterium]